MPGCLHQRAFIKGGFSHALLCHSQKELYIPCPVPWGWHPLCTGSMRGKLFPQLTKCPNWMVRGEAIWGELKVKWSQECPCGFLQNLLIKAAGISSWLTRFRYVSQVLQSNFFSFFFYYLCQISESWKYWKDCLLFILFLSQVPFENGFWAQHSLDTFLCSELLKWVFPCGKV